MGLIVLGIAMIAIFALLYALVLRPLLRRLAVLKQFWNVADDFERTSWQMVMELFDGLKIKILARLVWVPGAIVSLYDLIGPALAGADFTPLTEGWPSWLKTGLQITSAVLIPMAIDWARSSSASPQPPGA